MDNSQVTNQKFIDESESLSEISNFVISNSCFSRSIYDCKVKKEWFSFSKNFSLQIKNINDPKNIKLFVSNLDYKDESTESMINIINESPFISREDESRISVCMSNSTKELNEDDKSLLADKIASFIDFLLEKFPNATNLCIYNCGSLPKFDDFTCLIISKINACNYINEINGTDIFNILTYAKNHDLSTINFFKNFPNLHSFVICIDALENPPLIENYENEIGELLKFMSIHKNITFNFFMDDDTLSKEIMERICDNVDNMSLNVNIVYGLINTFFKNDNEFEDIVIKIKPYTTFFCFVVDSMDSFKRLETILRTFENLERLSITVDSDMIRNEIKKYGSMEKFIETFENVFNYKGTIKKLNKLEIIFDLYEYDEKIKAAYDKLRDKYLEKMLSIFPDNIKVLSFQQVNSIGDIVFDQISTLFPNLETISFLLTYNVPKEAFSKLQSLRHVVIHGELDVNIPEWVEIVLFCYYDSDFYYGCDNISENVKDDHYYEMMNRTFNHSLRNLKGDEIYYIAFLKNILRWKELISLKMEY
uniref:ORC_WH_C domain-containing protein n=1 Tax=Parastrongyloides trichosuri TaxID=131310 RepID=A0A0N4ZW28_PARTI